MTTTVLDRVPVEEITERARSVRPGRFALQVLATILFGIGFATAKVFAVLFLSGAWSVTALRVGYEAAHGPTRSQQIETLTAEVERLKAENFRLGG